MTVKALLLAGLTVLASGLAAEPGFDPEEGPQMAMAEGGPGEGMHGGPGMHGGKGGPGGGPMAILKQLDLSKEQKAKLKEMRRARRDKSQTRQNQLADLREDLHELLAVADRSKAHEDKLRAKHAEIQKLQQENQGNHFESMLEIRSVLTDAQLKKFIELHEQGGKGMKKMGKGRKMHAKPGPEDED